MTRTIQCSNNAHAERTGLEKINTFAYDPSRLHFLNYLRFKRTSIIYLVGIYVADLYIDTNPMETIIIKELSMNLYFNLIIIESEFGITSDSEDNEDETECHKFIILNLRSSDYITDYIKEIENYIIKKCFKRWDNDKKLITGIYKNDKIVFYISKKNHGKYDFPHKNRLNILKKGTFLENNIYKVDDHFKLKNNVCNVYVKWNYIPDYDSDDDIEDSDDEYSDDDQNFSNSNDKYKISDHYNELYNCDSDDESKNKNYEDYNEENEYLKLIGNNYNLILNKKIDNNENLKIDKLITKEYLKAVNLESSTDNLPYITYRDKKIEFLYEKDEIRFVVSRKIDKLSKFSRVKLDVLYRGYKWMAENRLLNYLDVNNLDDCINELFKLYKNKM